MAQTVATSSSSLTPDVVTTRPTLTGTGRETEREERGRERRGRKRKKERERGEGKREERGGEERAPLLDAVQFGLSSVVVRNKHPLSLLPVTQLNRNQALDRSNLTQCVQRPLIHLLHREYQTTNTFQERQRKALRITNNFRKLVNHVSYQ